MKYLKMVVTCISQECQREVVKSNTTFCGKPVCVGDVQCPKGAMTEAQKGLRERNMSLYSVRNYLLGFRRIKSKHVGAKKRISAIRRKTGIPD